MCEHYESVKDAGRPQRYFDAAPPADPGKSDVWRDVWPEYLSTFIRRLKDADNGDEIAPE